MKLPTIMRLPGHSIFEFKPRYWDQEKEEFEARVERAKREVGAGTVIDKNGKYVPNIKGQMRGQMSSPFKNIRKTETRKSNVRFFFILGILAFVFYYLFYY